VDSRLLAAVWLSAVGCTVVVEGPNYYDDNPDGVVAVGSTGASNPGYPQGDDGYTGCAAGYTGPCGNGYTGPNGDTGYSGPSGDTGYSGPSGDTGYSGPSGDTSDLGYTGASGATA
jgi:hypothetical protein